MNYTENCLQIIVMVGFMYCLYRGYQRPKIKEIKPPKETNKKPPKNKLIKRLKRIHIPYRGKAKIYTFTDKKRGYIESAWDEIQKPKKSNK